MLRLVADLLSTHKRRDDVLGRVGGEEFMLLLPAARLTLSVGIAELSSGAGSSHALLHAADHPLYAAKARGREQAVDFADADGAGFLIPSPIG
jgi:GGDEF domain-containing protein